MKAHRKKRGIAVLFLQPRRQVGCVVNATTRPLYPRERDPVPIVQEGGWAPGPVWSGAEENLMPTGNRYPKIEEKQINT